MALAVVEPGKLFNCLIDVKVIGQEAMKEPDSVDETSKFSWEVFEITETNEHSVDYDEFVPPM